MEDELLQQYDNNKIEVGYYLSLHFFFPAPFEAQPTNPFFATVNQKFGGSSQLPTTVERAVIKSNP